MKIRMFHDRTAKGVTTVLYCDVKIKWKKYRICYFSWKVFSKIREKCEICTVGKTRVRSNLQPYSDVRGAGF